MSCLDKAGWESAEAPDADIIIINSCGFIESAKQESINAVIEWRKLYPNKKILLAGCLAQRYAKELAGTLTEADGFFGTDNIASITDAVSKITGGAVSGAQAKPDNGDAVNSDAKPDTGKRPLLSLPGSAYVKISEGCSNRCSFCAIPLIRGNHVSRAIPDIVQECRSLIKRGIAELCIIGQDIGSFGIDTSAADVSRAKLPELLKAISALEGHFWVRLLYIHPDHFPIQILDIMEKDTRFLPYFDIPFQHASSKILTAMNRRGSAEEYLALLETIRTRLPRAVIRSTFLLGFPGETEEDFAELLDFQEKANMDWLGCFTYSREEGTPAFSMKGRVSAKTAEARKQKIEERQITITEKNMERFTGETLEVLIEERIDSAAEPGGEADIESAENFLLGRLYCQAPEIDGMAVIADSGANSGAEGNANEKSAQLGKFAKCKVIARRGFDLEVKLL